MKHAEEASNGPEVAEKIVPVLPGPGRAKELPGPTSHIAA